MSRVLGPSPGPGTRTGHPPFRIASLPRRSSNPYLALFYGALESHGYEQAEEAMLSLRWLWRVHRQIEAIHFHWPEYLWDGRAERPQRALAKLWMFLLTARRLGVRVLWTVHNVRPHSGTGWADRVGLRLMARYADLAICHSEGVAAEVARTFAPQGRLVVMPHGNYSGWYPKPAPRERTFAALGLDSSLPVLACVGQMRPNKGIDTVVEAVACMQGAVQLVIAGWPHPHMDLGALRDRTREVGGIVVTSREVTDQEYVDLVHASSLVALPYHEVTGSGSLLAAWSLGRSVVGSSLPFFEETARRTPKAMWFHDPGDVPGLAGAIMEALSVDPAVREQRAVDAAAYYDWDRCVQPLVEELAGFRDVPNT